MQNSGGIDAPPSKRHVGTVRRSHRRIQVEKPRQIRVLGVPLDLGASKRGVDMGPSGCAWRAGGASGGSRAPGDRRRQHPRGDRRDPTGRPAKRALLEAIAETCARTAKAVVEAMDQGLTPLLLGGDHSMAAGSVAGVSEYYRRRSDASA